MGAAETLVRRRNAGNISNGIFGTRAGRRAILRNLSSPGPGSAPVLDLFQFEHDFFAG